MLPGPHLWSALWLRAHLLGRLNATVGFLLWGAICLGSVLAALAGLRATLWIAAVIVALSALWPVLSPLRRMRDLPDPHEAVR